MSEPHVEHLVEEVQSLTPSDSATLLSTRPPSQIRETLAALPPEQALEIAAQLPRAAAKEEVDSGALAESLGGTITGLVETPHGVLQPQVTVAGALDYIVKPVEEERLNDALHRAREALKGKAASDRESKLIEMLASLSDDDSDRIKELIADPDWSEKQRYPERLSFKDGSKVVMLDADEIEWIDAAGD